MSDIMEHINLVDGLNLNPIPLEASQKLTTTEWLYAIEAKLNKVIDLRNDILLHAKEYTDEQVSIVKKELEDLLELINSGDFIKDGSITPEKLDKFRYEEYIKERVIDHVSNIGKFVWFGINKKGYFYALMPKNWEEILFSTDTKGHLVLTLKEV